MEPYSVTALLTAPFGTGYLYFDLFSVRLFHELICHTNALTASPLEVPCHSIKSGYLQDIPKRVPV